MENKALILVDLQNDYFSSFENAKFELDKAEEASNNAAKLLKIFREKSMKIVHIRHEGSKFFIKGTEGSQIHKSVEPIENEIVITKNFPNSFLKTNLKEILEESNIKSLIIVGAMSHMCIDATTRAASDFGYKCTVVKDATATRELEFNGIKIPSKYVHASFMAALEFAYAKIENTQDVIKGLNS